ncbi:MAG: DUF4434 domain-containing protein [Myxococcales bacterium]|nr:DUF4434 domain-containing protein [Myxococcales bacterium]
MNNTGQLFRLWFVALLVALLFSLAACETDSDDDSSADQGDDDDNDDNDDDDNDSAAPTLPPLDLVIVDPIYWLDKTRDDMAAELDAMRNENVGGLIWRWTARQDRVTYPSDAFVPFVSMAETDPLAVLLELAAARGLTVYLGLSAERRVGEFYADPIEPEAARVETLVAELAGRYGDSAALRGVYIPYEFVPAPDENETLLVTRIVGAVRRARADWQVLMTVRYPGFPEYRVLQEVWRHHGTMGFFLDWIDDGDYRRTWTIRVVDALKTAGIDIVLVAMRLGSHLNDLAGAMQDLDMLTEGREALGGSFALWTQVDLYDSLGGDRMRTAFGPLDDLTIDSQATVDAAGRVGFGWDYWRNADGSLHGISAVGEPELLAKAEAVREHLLGNTLRDGQLATVLDGQIPVNLFGNVWQEDTCWLTGLFLSVESYRYAVTGDPDALASAKALWKALLRMADVTPKRGEVVRNWSRYLYDQTDPVEPGADTIKRWYKHPTKEIYWIGDVSVDQLSGYFHGLATFYDLAADETEREEVRSITEAIMGDILDHHLHVVQFDGQPTTYGNLLAAPELAADFLLIAWHVTGNERYLREFRRQTYVEYLDIRAIFYHYAMHFIAQKYEGQHFQDSGYAHLFEYLDDPAAFHRWIWALEYVYQGSFLFGNTAANFTHQMHVPDSGGAARALAELNDFDPDLLENGLWFRKINQTWPENSWVGMESRPAVEYEWTWSPHGTTTQRGGPTYRFTGVGYLLTYWQGRYMGWIR